MSVSLSPYAGAGAQFFDNNGNPLAGGLIYTYAAGTTTPAATYTSNSGVTANANPIVLDSAGRTPAQIWLTEGSSYKFVLQTSLGVTVKTDDNIFASYELDLTGVADTQVLFINGSAASGSANLTFDGDILTVRSIEIGRGGANFASNLAIGINALSLNSAGVNLTAIGYEALYENTAGVDNTAIGYLSLRNNTTGSRNTAVGRGALGSNTSGEGNVALGKFASSGNTTGNYNIAIGQDCLTTASGASSNIAIGYLSLQKATAGDNIAIGVVSQANTTTGDRNTSVGVNSLPVVSTGSNNTAIGYGAGGVSTGSNNLILGNGATASALSVSNEITLGNSSITSLRVPGLTLTAGAKWINNGTQTVAALVAAGTAGAGARAVVTDASATTFHSIVAGGGANVVPVFSDGTNWRIG